MAVLAGASELAGGLFLALGFLTPLAGAGVIGIMVNAMVTAHSGNGPWAAKGGWELELTYAVVAAAVVFTGPGRYSLDHVFDWALAGTGRGIAAAVVGVYAALIVLAMRALAREGMHSTLGQAT
jgi:putative oxidoreductase